MNKSSLLLLLIFTLIMTACSGNTSDLAGPVSGAQGEPAAGELSAPMQVAIGTIKLDETDNAITAEQAAELLPLWQTLQVLYSSDTAANQEIDALATQIQEAMTDKQTQAITAMNLTRQDMFAIMQSQGMAFGGAQSGNAQSGGSTNNSGGGFGPGGGGFPPGGGAPPDGGGGPGFFVEGQGSQAQQSTDSTENSNRPTTVDPNRIPTPLLQAVIEYLKTKGGS